MTVCENIVCQVTGRLGVWVPANIAFACQVVCGSLVFGRELIHIKIYFKKVIDRTGDYYFSSFVMSQDVDSGAMIV